VAVAYMHYLSHGAFPNYLGFEAINERYKNLAVLLWVRFEAK
jgi:hypothetical protein